MKHIVFGLAATALVIVITMTVVTIDGKTTRSNEVDNSLHSVLKSALADVMERREYTVEDDDELIADLTAQLMRQLNTNDRNLTLDVDVAGVDAKKGLMAVHVKESFTYPNGRRGTAEDSACVVLEREKERGIYQISYKLTKDDAKKFHVGEVFRTFHITEGKNFKVPSSVYGKTVRYWLAEGTEIQITPKELAKKKVSKESSYVAVF